MLTTDLSLREDPEYLKISKRFHENPAEFAEVFSRAWYKLTHRDMGPVSRYLGSEVPKEELIWQDPIPANTKAELTENDIKQLKEAIRNSDLSVGELVSTAWASASTFRGSDMRGGANGGRLRLSPQKEWTANNPTQLAKVLSVYESIQQEFNQEQADKLVSIADLLVLGGSVGVEIAVKNAGEDLVVPFLAGRTDATPEMTDVESFDVLEPKADGFRNFLKAKYSVKGEELLLDQAQLLTLTVPEMTVLIGGMRMLNTNVDKSSNGVFTSKSETLSNDYFVNLLDLNTQWRAISDDQEIFEGRDRATGEVKWTGSRVDLIFGSNSELRAIAEIYGSADSKPKFIKDFVKAWTKVMNLDRFDLK